ncbi:TetR/AcrR family transcriptional regulator [Nitrospirillum iridis]|uniref:AcrR family transcriptional regulator n=1 Tax=Nitrospirillum iridis TaxID=765888 RepID=A0A7X0AZZ1_9PROT|nr:TetR-like C-terminal domain-containing protein [Nitrospirillum iridis]MBB6251826.1 AcrR family transcriptional regulator [Nitrospirillum iridis]
MARRSDHSRDELAALVLEAARKIVVEEGAEAVTMRKMGALIGYAPGSIYNAVGDLEAVLRQVNATTLTEMADQLDAVMAAHVPGTLENALAIAEKYVDFVLKNPRLWAALLKQPPRPGEAVPESYSRPRARLIEIVATAIAPLFTDALARQKAVVALWAALQGVASLASGGNYEFFAGDIDSKEIARSIVRRYLTGTD